MRTRRINVSTAALGVFLLAWPALAADAGGTTVNLAPLSDVLIGAAASLLSGIVTIAALWVRHYLKARLGIELDASTREYVQDAADRAADLVQAKMKALLNGPIGAKSALTVDVHHALLADAVDMLVEQVPDGLTRLGLGTDNVRHMLMTRLAARGYLPPEDGVPAGAALPD